MAANTQSVDTLGDRINEVAAYANLTPRAVTLLQRFFLKVATEDELKELDDWMHESNANDQLFDLLLDLNRDGAGAAMIHLLNKFTKKEEPPRHSWLMKNWWRLLVGFFVIALLQQVFWPPYPITVTTKDEAKTFWIHDSTRVELMPHSKLTYPSRFVIFREVQLTGNATFMVRHELLSSFYVEIGEIEIKIPKDTVTVIGNRVVIHQPKQ